MYTHKKMKTTAETSLAVLKEVLPLLKAQEDYSNDALYAMLSAYVAEKGYKNGYVMWPIRTATSGKQMTCLLYTSAAGFHGVRRTGI